MRKVFIIIIILLVLFFPFFFIIKSYDWFSKDINNSKNLIGNTIILKGLINTSTSKCIFPLETNNETICLNIPDNLSNSPYLYIYNISYFKYGGCFVSVKGVIEEPNFFNETFYVTEIELDKENVYNKDEAYCKSDDDCYGIYENREAGELIKCINIYNEHIYIFTNYTLGQIYPNYCICKDNQCKS